MKYQIRPMLESDIQDVINGEKEIFGESLGEDFLLQELKINPFSYYFVLEIDEHIEGYMGTWINENAEILNFYVSKEFQNMGFGSLMLDFFINLCLSVHVKSLTLEVRESNIKAIELYKKYDLKEVSIRKNYYSNGDNALLMERKFEE